MLRINMAKHHNKRTTGTQGRGEKSVASFYYSITDIYGVVSQLGSKNLDSKTKSLSLDSLPYKIHISGEQDLELKPYYDTEKLKLKVRLKRSAIDSHIVSAEMVEFSSVGNKSFADKLRESEYIDLEIIKQTHSIDYKG